MKRPTAETNFLPQTFYAGIGPNLNQNNANYAQISSDMKVSEEIHASQNNVSEINKTIKIKVIFVYIFTISAKF